MKKILNMTMALLSSAILSPELYAATTSTTVTEAERPTVALHNADGTRPRISFQPISEAFEGERTLVQMDETGKIGPILKLTVHKNQIVAVKALSEGEEDESIGLVEGIWRFNRDQKSPENPRGTRIKPGKLAFFLMENEQFGTSLNLGPKEWSHQQTLEGKTQKLEALNIDLSTKGVLVKYAPMGEVAPASTTAFFFDRGAHGFLDNAPMLEKAAQAIEGHQSFLSQRNMYTINDAKSITFSATQNQRNIFLFGLAKSYLQNLFKEPSNQRLEDRFKTMSNQELRKLAGSLVSWLQEATISGQRILTETEKNTFFETIFNALKALQGEMMQPVQQPTNPDAAQTPSPKPEIQKPSRVQELRKRFEEQPIGVPLPKANND